MVKLKLLMVLAILLFVGGANGAHISAVVESTTQRNATTIATSESQQSHREEIKYCTDEQDTTFKLKMGEQGPGPKGTCKLVKCEDVVNGKAIFKAIGCGVFIPTPGCNSTDYDNSKTYPDCCPNEIC